jgi:hypothetical protein
MSSRHASVKLSADFLDEARREAEVFNRSLGAQVEHWARIGRMFERTPGVGVDRVRQALEGRLGYEDLSPAERDAFSLQFGATFDADVEAAYAALGAGEGAAGSDEAGRLVRRDGSGRLVPIG